METKYMDNRTFGERAYDEFGKTVDHNNYQGLPMPEWKDLTPKIREAWENVENANMPPAPNPVWYRAFDFRQQEHIRFSRLYAAQFHHGADGHNSMMIIAQMADLLDKLE